ncbi:hypothetical protein ALC53_00106, partial [Atta colombica]
VTKEQKRMKQAKNLEEGRIFNYQLNSKLLAEWHFDSYEDIRKWLNEWFASKDGRNFFEEEFFWRSTQIA